MNVIAIIPARMASTRLPGKPLADILGMPMIGHVFHRAKLCDSLQQVYVATCDEAIATYIASIGGSVVMTSPTHERASDRAAEAMATIEAQTGRRVDIVVMIQGDEPMITPGMIEAAIEPLRTNPDIGVVNVMTEMRSLTEFEDPNEVKVVVDREGHALYFSREPIPSRKKGASSVPMRKQVCIIPFRRDFLLAYNAWEQTPLEIAESIDMNRVLEHGHRIQMVSRHECTYSVDTPDDLTHVAAMMANDPLIRVYAS